MPTVDYRPVRENEILETVEVFFTSRDEMYARRGATPPSLEREATEACFHYISQTGIFYVAEVDGRIGAICHAIVRDHLWFLSGFWVLPALQRQKIGGQLLKRVWAAGERARARTFFVWSSIDDTAIATYLKMGMLPGYQILTFSGSVVGLPEKPAGYVAQPLSLGAATRLDEEISATGRETDHRFWLFRAGYRGRQVLREGQLAGYYYLDNGNIGPAAWIEPQCAIAMLSMAFREAAEQSESLRLLIPGINHEAIRFSLKAGLRLTGYAHFLTTASFGHLDQYLASGPLLF